MDYQVHETAIIDDGAQIGSGSRIWQWVHVCGGARLVLVYHLVKMFLLLIMFALEIDVRFKITFLFMIMFT